MHKALFCELGAIIGRLYVHHALAEIDFSSCTPRSLLNRHITSVDIDIIDSMVDDTRAALGISAGTWLPPPESNDVSIMTCFDWNSQLLVEL